MKLVKTFLITLFPVAGACAQSNPQAAPRLTPDYTIKGLMTDSLTGKLGSMLSPKSYLNGSLNPLNQQLQVALNTNAQTVYSRMPVVGLSSADNMPVAKPYAGTRYTMPVKHYKVTDPLTIAEPVTINP